MIRLFAAIAIPHGVAQDLARRQHGLPGARWRPAASLHLTLRFFGEISERAADDLDAELAAVAARRFELTLAGAGAFADGAQLRAVWAGVEPAEALSRLAARCERAARRAALAPDTRVWKPHVTLAYLRDAAPAKVAAWIQDHNLLRSAPILVDRFGLYSSHRAEGGPDYGLERDYPLSP